jgi:hypothetical protein
MKVSVVRSGGFAGIERRGEAHTHTDPVLRRLVDAVDLDAVPRPERSPDQFVYEIEVDGRTAVVGERELTGPLRDLVDRVLSPS